MKKIVIALIILSVAFLSFWAGGRYGEKRSATTRPQGEVTRIDIVDERQDDSPAPLVPGAVKISPERQQLIGMKVAAIEKRPMTYTLRLYGRVVADETRVYRVNASTDSWIRELSSVTTGSIVQKNQILAEALAPAYYNAQLTYVLSLDNIDRIRRQLGGEVRHQQADLADNQIRMAVQSMQVLGITDAQIEELAKTRKARPYLQVRAPSNGVVLSRNITLNQWFKAAEEFYTIADIGKVWVYADVYENEARNLKPGLRVKVVQTQMGKAFGARVGEVLPLFDPVTRTLKVRIDVDNPRYDLRPDMFVDVEIPITMPPSLNVPADAVVDTGTKAIVYVDKGNGIFEPRRVKTGWNLGGQVEITGGLMPGEKIVVSGNFLIDSESRMEIAALGTEVKMSEDPVCGMEVDKDEAKPFARIATYANETFYFCSDRCKKEFEKEPGKYVRKQETDRKKENRATLPEAGYDYSKMKKHKLDSIGGDEHAHHGTGTMKDKLTDSAKTGVPGKAKPDGMDMAQPQAAMPGEEDDSEETREGPYPFPGAQYLGTVPREKAPAKDEPPKDRLPPRQFEIPAAPPTGTRLK